MEDEEFLTRQKVVSRDFLTGSHFDGVTAKSGRIINGYGVYTYPSGDQFCGFFQDGKFHGYGRMKRIGQKRFSLVGTWEHGKLKNIDKMTFNDGLDCKGDLKDDLTLDTTNWDYCTNNDRRFFSDSRYGMTTALYAPELGVGRYDAGHGVMVDGTGAMSRQLYPLPPNSFIGCREYRDWIIKYCRRGMTEAEQKQGPDIPNRKEILKTNMEENSMRTLNEDHICQTIAKAKAAAEKLRKNQQMPEPFSLKEPVSDITPELSPAPSFRCSHNDSSETCASFEPPILLIDVPKSANVSMKKANVMQETKAASGMSRRSDVSFRIP